MAKTNCSPAARVAAALVVPLLVALTDGGCVWSRHLRAPPAGARQHVVSLRQVASGDALDQAAAKVEDQPGVHRADADRVHAEIKIWTRAEIDDVSLVSALSGAGFDVVAGAGQGSYRPPPGYLARSDARILTLTGEDIEDLSIHVVPGKVTIFDFYADWCGPCRALDGLLVSLLASHDDVALRKVNIVTFDRPVARRWVGNGIPLVLIFNRAGQPLARLRGLNPKQMALALSAAGLGDPRAPPLSDSPPVGARQVSSHVGGVQRLANLSDPLYRPGIPPELYRPGERYQGLFQVCVSDRGDVTYVHTLTSTGVPELDARWKQAIAYWPHDPLQVDGARIPFCYPVRLDVKMEGPLPDARGGP